MQLQSVFDEKFSVYGQVLTEYDFTPLLKLLCETTEKPIDHTIYIPDDPKLDALPIFNELSNRFYGGMPIQIGYCNGSNHILNCLEYHRDCEVNIVADDMIFLVASKQKLQDGILNTSEVEAFCAPAGTAVQLYETTLHYAPCNVIDNSGFRVVVVLPRGTNTDKPQIAPQNLEDKLLWARNKWLIAHPDSDEAKQGAFIGLHGINIKL